MDLEGPISCWFDGALEVPGGGGGALSPWAGARFQEPIHVVRICLPGKEQVGCMRGRQREGREEPFQALGVPSLPPLWGRWWLPDWNWDYNANSERVLVRRELSAA
ncbi:hypothetical protein FB45DRAFT_870155 [Roridomyces roridus]|uniref:Uncharacterized protein n=1 Tax=Roridomyces roridus TaxID=1738132 RepID=A0AAD7BKY5_9AGAR|nr:hypothetical protein FB45DRAFT_870155 [Roridomyces roridus]